MAKLDLISIEWTDIIFEGRNQLYGGYTLRNETGKRNVWSVIIVALSAALLYLGLTIHRMTKDNNVVINTPVVVSPALPPKPADAHVEKRHTQVEAEKTVNIPKSSIKFTAPVIRKDDLVDEKDEIDLDVIEKSDKAIGAYNVEGDDVAGRDVLHSNEKIEAPEPPKPVDDQKIFKVVQQMPSFPGGDAALMSWIGKNIRYPALAEENHIEGRVVLQFVVEKDGAITDVQIVKGVDPSLDKEAMRVVKSMPHWLPGKQNGTPVRVKYTFPVMFKLQ